MLNHTQKKEDDLVDLPENINLLSLCTGYGGLDLGLRRALPSLRSVCSVEIEAFALGNLVSKIENGLIEPHPLFSDLKSLDWSLFSGRVDVLSGGFPCQSFSQAGARRADEDPRHLFPFIRRGISVVRPPLVFLENVEGLLTSKLKGDGWRDPEGTPVLLHVLRELERMDYSPEAGVFSAEEVGSTHRRNRVFILALDNNLPERSRVLLDRVLRSSLSSSESSRPLYPAPRDCDQYVWEPRRVLPEEVSGETVDDRERPRSLRREAEEADREESRREGASRSAPETGPPSRELQGDDQSSLDRVSDGSSDRMVFPELFSSVDSLVDEMRLLGNAVVPETAERAFRVLWRRLRG